MADYRTLLSCIFDTGSADNRMRADAIRGELRAELDRNGEEIGFEVAPSPEHGEGALWLYAAEFGEPEHVIAFVLRCARAFGLSGRWGFRFAHSCSKPRLDAYGGGAVVLDLGTRETVAWLFPLCQ